MRREPARAATVAGVSATDRRSGVPVRAPRRLVVAWGNEARGDDALGPLLLARLRARADTAPWGRGVTWRLEHQLQVELVEVMRDQAGILFLDASRTAAAPFEAPPLTPAAARSVSTHSLPPDALLRAFVDVYGAPPPPATLLAVRGASFALGAPLSAVARAHLDAAAEWAEQWLRETAVHLPQPRPSRRR